MAKLTISDLQAMRRKLQEERQTREGNARGQIIVHMGTCGIAAGARKVMTALLDAMDKQNVRDVIVSTSACAGMCSKEPMATVQMSRQTPVKYISLNEEKIVRILNDHVLKGNVVKEFALAVGSERVG